MAIAISILVFTPSVALAEQAPPTTIPESVVSASEVEGVNPGVVLKQSLTYTKKPKATEKFWDRLAYCETHGDWKNGGNWAGGLGIAQSTWYAFGGREFARSPHLATRQEQIVVANRISTQGYQTKNRYKTLDDKINNRPRFQPPVGFSGWGALPCAGGRPRLFHYDDFKAVTRVPYRFNERSLMVKDLQNFLRITPDGRYGEKTRQAHIKFLRKHKISTKGIIPPLPRKASVSAQSVGNDKSCPQYEKLLRKHGLPVKEFSSIMWRESRCQPKAIGWNYKRGKSHRDCRLSPAVTYRRCSAVSSYDSGLLQINSTWRTITARVCERPARQIIKSLTNPECNLKVARYLYDNGGLGHWKATSGKK